MVPKSIANSHPPPSPPGDPALLDSTLDHIFASPAFRNSKQCQKFLRYVVDHSHGAADHMLKERTIGIEVFGREPAYETGDDPVVRVRATEVRKRLAQFYQESAVPEDVHLEIPQGSYRVEFHWPAPTPEPPPAPAPAAPEPEPVPAPLPTLPAPRNTRRLWIAASLAILTLAALATWMVRDRRPGTALDRFWAPVLASPKPVLLYCGQPVAYFLSADIHKRYRATTPPDQRRGSYTIRLDPDEVLHGRDIIPVTGQFVGIGNAHTAATLNAMFALRGKPVEIRYANDLSFADLRGASSILIGAFSNLWTLEMTGQLRFVFEQDEGARRIRDRTAGLTWQPARIEPDGQTTEDFSVVSRVFDSATGQILVAAAGITQYGTRSAGEFLTDPARFDEALAKAPSDWPRRNLQVLLRTPVYKGTPAPPKVIAAHFW